MDGLRTGRSRLRLAITLAALTLLVGSALQTNIVNLVHLYRVIPAPEDFMARHDQRFEPLREALPKRGIIGYMSDAPNEYERELRRSLAQYSLAPLIVQAGTTQPLIVGEFTDPAAVARGRELQLTVVRDFGNGLILFARGPQ